MKTRFLAVFVLCLLALGLSTAHAQDLELISVEDLPLPTPTPTDPVPATDQIASPLDAAGEGTSANVATQPIRELKGEPIQQGPIHEAFANPLQLTPNPAEPRKKAPPAPIEELPPDAQPDAKNAQWIPGYWAWDEQRNDYVWVSGVYRKVPKSRTWVAGRWEETEAGHQWVPGDWMKTDADGAIVQDEVLPTPPESLEQGPTSPAPSDDHFWIPGVWNRTDRGQYAWRPGFWSQSQTNWVWVPDHYSWRPQGCTYVPGYWDYTWERRGTLYAPCTFASSDLTGRVCYRPSSIIDSSQWLANLWVGPSSRNYYYGNYYDHVGHGYSPWYSYYGRNSRYYDPFYSYYRWRFPISYGIGLYGYLDGLHSHYHQHSSYRPRISFYGTNDWNRRSRGYTSLYGNVDLHRSHTRAGSYDHHDHARMDRARQRGYAYGNQRRGSDVRDIRNRANNAGRNVVGYANGTALDRNRRGPGISRAEIGTSGAPGISRSDIGRGRSDIDRLRGVRDQRMRATPEARGLRGGDSRRNDARTLATPSPGPIHVDAGNPSSRPNARPQVRQPRPRASATPQITQSRPRVNSPQTSRPRPNVTRSAPQVSRPRPNVTRSAPQVSRPRPNVTRSAPQVSRPRPNVSRSAPQVSRPRASAPRPAARSSSPGFSTHGMKKARGANLAKQRAAMQSRISGKKK